MTTPATLIETLALSGLEIAPSQLRGTVRLVPLLRRDSPGDLRLARRAYHEDVAVVSLPDSNYISYVPHGLVLSWNSDVSAVSAFGANLQASDGRRFAGGSASIRLLHRMAKRENKNQLRFLPMHLAMEGFLAADLLGRSVQAERVYQAGPFTLQRFRTDLDPAQENHIGEAIVRADGRLEYLKTYRLSAAQTRRAYLLSQLSEADWSLEVAAERLNTTTPELILRLEKAGFGYLIMQHVRDAARKSRRA